MVFLLTLGSITLNACTVPTFGLPNLSKVPIQSVSDSYTFVSSKFSSLYMEHAPISINGNEDFLTQAASENWPGTGAVEDPINITGYDITIASGDLLTIQNTSLYFRVQGNIFRESENGGWTIGIQLNYTRNGIIEDNLIENVNEGIYQFHSPNITISNNTFKNCSTGVRLWGFSDQNFVTNNIFIGHGSVSGSGIALQDLCTNNLIANNTIISDSGTLAAIRLLRCSFNNITGNIITGCQKGIYLDSDSNLNLIKYNVVTGSSSYGIFISNFPPAPCKNNRITLNHFINNNPDHSQGFDNGSRNTFTHNYWNNWTTPDEDNDGIVDRFYPIDGTTNSQDSYPLTTPLTSLHQLTVIVLSPNGGETLKNTTIIRWATTNDSWGHTVTYSVYYTVNNGASWVLLASSLTMTSYTWNTSTAPDGSNYIIRVVARCTGNLITEDTSDATFIIQNTQTNTSTSSTPISSTPPSSTPTSSTTTPGLTPALLLFIFSAMTGSLLLLAVWAIIGIRRMKRESS
ncbi:MAG: nitrous oxide reductase family maturation protein NosD [Candidatus Hodarchaeota archaeon]